MPRGVYHRTAAALANVKKAAKGQDRRIKISAARKEYWATRTLDQIVAFKKMRSELANTQWHNITDNQRTARRLAARKTRESRSPEYQALLNSAWAEKSRQSWADMTLADKRERVIKQAPTRKDYTLIDGSIAGFHSSWEAACANVLIELGIKYKMQYAFDLGSVCWLSDFCMPHRHIIIEVKGHYRASARWDDIIAPAIHRSRLTKQYKIYVLRKSPALGWNTFQQFLDTLEML